MEEHHGVQAVYTIFRLHSAQAQRHSIPFKEELNGLLSTLSDTGDTIERWFKVPASG